MILGIFTEEKRTFTGDSSPVCLSWHLHGSTADFTFRTKIFNDFPDDIRHMNDIFLVPNKKYEIKCRIWLDKAEYYVDG